MQTELIPKRKMAENNTIKKQLNTVSKPGKYRYTKDELMKINRVSDKTKDVPKLFMQNCYCFEKVFTNLNKANKLWNPEIYWKAKMDEKYNRTWRMSMDSKNYQKKPVDNYSKQNKTTTQSEVKPVYSFKTDEKDKKIVQLENAIQQLTDQISKLSTNLASTKNKKEKESNESGYDSQMSSFNASKSSVDIDEKPSQSELYQSNNCQTACCCRSSSINPHSYLIPQTPAYMMHQQIQPMQLPAYPVLLSQISNQVFDIQNIKRVYQTALLKNIMKRNPR